MRESRVTVTELLLNFRRALASMVPFAERAGVPWRQPDAYDAWDAIATALFESLVADALRWQFPEEVHEAFSLPAYDLLLPDYGARCAIEVSHPALSPSARHVFHRFGTQREPFDLIEVRAVSPAGAPLDEGVQRCPLEGARFAFRPVPPLGDGRLVEVLRAGR